MGTLRKVVFGWLSFRPSHAKNQNSLLRPLNNFGNTIFGINITGQGINGVVEATHVVGLRHLVTKLSRRLSLHPNTLRPHLRRLEEAGVPATVSRYDGMIHGFFRMPGVIDRANDALEEAA